eukprot:Nitzschia sp. Nitz4//scaffold296_size27349//17842//21644//NITZ4_008200-RA/size27349-snap-gene-0.41-mRNA-1//-1//CDS//3329546273//6515//frame0
MRPPICCDYDYIGSIFSFSHPLTIDTMGPSPTDGKRSPETRSLRSNTDSSAESKRASLVKGELADLEALREGGRHNVLHEATTNCFENLWYSLHALKRKPIIVVVSSFVLLALLALGLAIVFIISTNEDETNKRDALDLAEQTGGWFSDQLDQAILPLFSLAQFVGEIDGFYALAEKLEEREPHNGYRNASGICDDETVVSRYNTIARNIKANANMEGVLVSLQIVPDQVVCLIYPLVNTEDFDNGVVMNSTGAVGLDLVAMPTRTEFSESVMESDGIYIEGPVTLSQCSENGKCSGSVEKVFIASLPVESVNHTIEVGDKTYDRWGSVEALINWKALIDRSNIYESFASEETGFRLSRRDWVVHSETGNATSEIIVLAETDDFHETKYTRVTVALDTIDSEWEMTIAYVENSSSWLPYAIAGVVLLSLGITLLVSMIMVQKENFRVMQKRYLEDVAQPQKLRLRMFLDTQTKEQPSEEAETMALNSHPIADFFPACTVLFADIAGFSSWSSEREPSQVFKLLQTVFYHFDKICQDRGVFKVDTSGDAYMVVAGLPEPQPDHVVRMCKFAQQCLMKFNTLTQELEKQLGPETGDLKLRLGLSSGPVIGGILLRGDAKFHVVGRTVMLASAMEATAEPGAIQLSERTADLLFESGKKKWIQARKDQVYVKGVGEVQTYYITNRRKGRSRPADEGDLVSYCSDLSAGDGELWGDDGDEFLSKQLQGVSDGNKIDRLVDYQVESLLLLLRKIVAFRNKGRKFAKKPTRFSQTLETKDTVLEEVEEIIELPEFKNRKVNSLSLDASAVQLEPAVTSQLRELVERIASMYHQNPFHNFDHANHVCMSVHKLLNRIVAPEEVDYDQRNQRKVAQSLHDYTFGITSDPLTHFAVVFSALIHDVDHRGVSNLQLSKEQPALGDKYKLQSVAEQNSVDLTWELLMKPEFRDFRDCLFENRDDFIRFRQLIVNSVMATDIFDPELKALRNMRWDKAFHPDELQQENESSSIDDSSRILPGSEGGGSHHNSALKSRKQMSTNRKATIVIEHIIQASDVAHTMQHWNVYKKWNERLFQEMHVAYKKGRAPKDPAQGWYKGELWFFDNYVIPLAKKLDECGVFGVASDECLLNAIENRREWALKGESVVAEMIANCKGIDAALRVVREDDVVA